MPNLFIQHVFCCWLCTCDRVFYWYDKRQLGSYQWLMSNWIFEKFISRLLISLKNGSIHGTNILILIIRWISNKNSKFNTNCCVEQTLQHSLIPLFFGTPCMFSYFFASLLPCKAYGTWIIAGEKTYKRQKLMNR